MILLQDSLAVWNGRRVIIYEYAEDKSTIKASGKIVLITFKLSVGHSRLELR